MLKKGFAVILVLLLSVGCILPAGASYGGAFDECVQMLNEYINGGCAEPYMTDPDDEFNQIRKIDYMSNIFMFAREYDARGICFYCDAIKHIEDEMFTIASEPLALLMTERNLNEYLSLWSDPEADVVMLLLDYSKGRRLEFEGDAAGALEAYRLCQGFMDADARLAALGENQDPAEELPEIMPVWDRLYARVSSANANLYAMPSENSSGVGVVLQGSSYLLTGFGGEWICIENEMNGDVGYGRIQDFEITQIVTPTAAPSQRPVITPIPTPVPTPVLTPVPTPTPTPTTRPLNYSTGDRVYFGHYEQDNYYGNGKEEILWRVLTVQGNSALLISEMGLDSHPFHYENIKNTWETCSLRQWLNNDFYNTAFSSDEKKRIQSVTLQNSDNPTYKTASGRDTVDRVFLLSLSEASRYFSSNKDRLVISTEYARSNGSRVLKGYSLWSLRDPGKFANYNANVNYYGEVNDYGDKFTDTRPVIRPAIWITLR